MDQAKVSQARLSSASDGAGIVLCDKEAGYPGNFIDFLQLRSQADDACVLRDFHRNA